MTLLDKVSGVQKDIAALEAVKKLREDASGMDDLRSQIVGTVKQRHVDIERLRLLKKNSEHEFAEPPSPQKFKEALRDVVETFEDDPGALTRGKRFKNLLQQLDGFLSSVAVQRSAAWKQYTSTFPAPNEGLMKRLAGVPGNRETVDAIRRAEREVQELAETPPALQEQWDKLKTHLVRLEEALAQLENSADIPEAVFSFFKKAQSQGATLEDLTDEVRAWLEDNGQSSIVRIKVERK